MSQLHTQKDYVLVFFQPNENAEIGKKIQALRQTTTG
jgi:hypothetical protein